MPALHFPQEILDSICDQVGISYGHHPGIGPYGQMGTLCTLARTSSSFLERSRSILYRFLEAPDPKGKITSIVNHNPDLCRYARALNLRLDSYTSSHAELSGILDKLNGLTEVRSNSRTASGHGPYVFDELAPDLQDMVCKLFTQPLTIVHLDLLVDFPSSILVRVLTLQILKIGNDVTLDEGKWKGQPYPFKLKSLQWLDRLNTSFTPPIHRLCSAPNDRLAVLEITISSMATHREVWSVLQDEAIGASLNSLLLTYTSKFRPHSPNLLQSGYSLRPFTSLRYFKIQVHTDGDITDPSRPEFFKSPPHTVPRFFASLLGTQPVLEAVWLEVTWRITEIPEYRIVHPDWGWTLLDDALADANALPRLRALCMFHRKEISFPWDMDGVPLDVYERIEGDFDPEIISAGFPKSSRRMEACDVGWPGTDVLFHSVASEVSAYWNLVY